MFERVKTDINSLFTYNGTIKLGSDSSKSGFVETGNFKPINFPK